MTVNVFDPAFDIPHPVNQFPPAFDLTGVLPPAAIERYFTELASAGSQYYTIPEITLAGDFEIEFNFSTTAATTQVLVGEVGANRNFVALISTSALQVKIDTVQVINVSTSAYRDGKLHAGRVVRTGSSVELFVDGVSIGSGTSSNNFIINAVGAHNTPAALFNGIISNVRIKDNGVLVRSYDIDEDWVGSNVLVNSAAELGSERLQDMVVGLLGTATPATYNTSTGEGQCTRIDGSNLSFVEITGLSSGAEYLVSIENTGSVLLSIRQNGSAVVINSIAAGDTEEFMVSTETYQDLRVQCALGTSNFTINSVRRADGYGTAVNITDADAQNYVFNGNVSPNTWTADDTTVIEVAGT